jgi:hypothetical protein
VSVTTSGVALANEGVTTAGAVDRTFFGVLGGGLPMLTAALAALAETRSDSAREANTAASRVDDHRARYNQRFRPG